MSKHMLRLISSPRYVRLRAIAVSAERSCSQSRSYADWANRSASELIHMLERFRFVWLGRLNHG